MEKAKLNMAKNYNMSESVININVPEIDKILSYPEPDYFTLNEKVYNQEVLQVLTRLDPTVPGYTKINDCFDADSIIALKKLKKHYGKDGHIVNYSKKTNKAKKGRYYINNKKKDDTSCLQTTYKVVRRLLLNGQCVSIDMVNAHIEIMKNISRFLKIDDKDIKILNDYCIGILTVFINKKIFKKNKFNEKYNIIGDFDFFLKVSLKHKIGSMQESLATYRVHKKNYSFINLKQYIIEFNIWIKDNEKNYKERGFSLFFLKFYPSVEQFHYY